MTNNNIFDVIGNAKDELERAYELLKDNEDALDTMLLQDIEFSIDELDELGDRISFALVLAVYTAYLNAESGYKDSCDNSVWRNAFVEEASGVDLKYDGTPAAVSEWAYNAADEIAKKIFQKHHEKKEVENI